MNARLLTPAYRAAMNGGTSGRPEFRGFHNTPSGRVLAWWADGSVAIRTRTGAEGDFAGEWTALPPLDYDALFVTDAVPADVPVADAAPSTWRCENGTTCANCGWGLLAHARQTYCPAPREGHAVPVADAPERVGTSDKTWPCTCDGETSVHCEFCRPPALPDGAHWCECPFPRSTKPNGMVCSACDGWR